MVDDEDYEWISSFNWSAEVGKKSVYAVRNARNESGCRKTQRMHRLIMGVTDPKIDIDHKNHNGIDNQRINLRVSTTSQNMKNRRVGRNNTTGFKGVSWHKRDEKYSAQYGVNGKKINIGSFDCPIEAARHYNKVALEHGEGFELLNDINPLFPDPKYLTGREKNTIERRGRTDKYLDDLSNGLYDKKLHGLSFHKRSGKWTVTISRKHIGVYITQDEAIEAQNAEMRKTQC